MSWSGAVEQFRGGDDHGVDTLFAAVSECARAQLLHKVDRQVVDDYVQEVLIIVMGAVRSGELRDPQCLMGFVRTVTRRQVALHIRGAIVSRRRMVSVEATSVPATPSRESPEALVALQQRIAAVEQILYALCPRDREILVRFYCDEQDSAQICLEMRLTSTQFRLYKSRALAKCGELRISAGRAQSTRPLRIA
jgi:RNA polymerase sigma factor (sigma-70 family)